MIYDYKSKELVQDILIECLCPLMDDVIDEYHTLHRDENLSIYTPSYIAREILGRLLDIEDVNEDECENEFWVDAESDNYLLYKDDNEVVITIGYDGMIFVESARAKDGRILRSESVLTYVYDEFSQKDVEKLSRGEYSVLVFGFEDECELDCSYDEDDECECCQCCADCDVCGCDDEESEGCKDLADSSNNEVAVKSQEQYFVNGKEVTKEEYKKISKEFEDKLKESLESFGSWSYFTRKLLEHF